MKELKFAVESGLKVELKVLSNGEIQVSWNEGNSVYITDEKEIVELGLIEQILTVDFNTQKEQYEYLVGRLLRECKSKNGYIGVEFDNIYVTNLESKDDTLASVLFFRILVEMEALSDHGNELIKDEFDEELRFRSEYNVKQHVKRLGKFIIKYANKYFKEELANFYVKEATAYIG